MRQIRRLDLAELEPTGVDFEWRNSTVDLNIQPMEALDLEQNKNSIGKVIHKMWIRKSATNSMLDQDRPGLHSAPGLGVIRVASSAVIREMALANSFFTHFKTWLSGELVGEDAYGNRYYREKRTPAGRRERRWVVYSKEAEPTRVPPGWVGWLHGRIKEAPSQTPLPSPHFEAEPMPNATGTAEAYLPPGAVQRGGTRAHATGDYEAWRPGDTPGR